MIVPAKQYLKLKTLIISNTLGTFLLLTIVRDMTICKNLDSLIA